MVIGNFKNSRGHLEAYIAIVQNDHVTPILGLITMPIVINVEPVSSRYDCILYLSRRLDVVPRV